MVAANLLRSILAPLVHDVIRRLRRSGHHRPFGEWGVTDEFVGDRAVPDAVIERCQLARWFSLRVPRRVNSFNAPDVAAAAGEENPTPPASQNKSC
jgi:hypothetical protein